MNTHLDDSSFYSHPSGMAHIPGRLSAHILLLAGCCFAAHGQSIIDNFDDANDDGWTRADAIGGLTAPPASFSFPNGAYRLEAPNPAVADAGQARATSYRADVAYTDFFVAVDIVDWDNRLDQGIGLAVRLSNVGLGQTEGYIIMYYANPSTSEPYGEFEIDSISGEALEATLTVEHIKLDPERSYRMVATASGSILKAYMYDLEDLTKPLAELTVENATNHPSGFVGVTTFYRGNDITADSSRGDVTFDNFWAMPSRPDSVAPPATPHSVPGAPQVVERVPLSHENFHPVDAGINFRATTLSEGIVDVAAITLLLNGVDRSDQLTVDASGVDPLVSFNALEANRVYQAEIYLTANGITTRNAFAFDTFVEEAWDGDAYMVIETEDYNFGERECDFVNGTTPNQGGQFLDDPELTNVNLEGFVIPEGAIGYGGTVGVRDVDYFDFAEFLAFAPDDSFYRVCDGVGIRTSSDTLRQKYVAADLQEQEVYRSEAGEWLNYTRTFPAGAKNLYLRAASQWAQTVRLDQVTSDPRSSPQTLVELGRFPVPNTVSADRYVYVPLTDLQGNLVELDLEGVQTLRTTIEGEPQEFTTKYNLFTNYLLMVPADSSPPLPAEIVLAPPQLSGNTFSFSFATIDGVTYIPEYKESLNDSQWTELNPVTGDGNAKTIEEIIQDASRIYRVRAQ